MAEHSSKARATASQVAFALALALSRSSVATADTADPLAAIEARQAGFKDIVGPAMRTINNGLRTEAPNLAALAAPAALVAEQASNVAGWFPPGSDASAGIPTKALPSVWTDRKEFDEIASQLVLDANALVAAVESGDLEAVKTQARTVGANCAACHRKYRD